MNSMYKSWQKLFLFALGLFAGTAFCMKWIETDFRQGGQLFTMIGLEITYDKDKIISILSGLDDKVRTILRYQLYFDFAFMAGVYPGIAALCMMAREKAANRNLRKILMALAALQTIAWLFDIIENCYLLHWIKSPDQVTDMVSYHLIVYTKWGLAITGALSGILFSLLRSKKKATALS